MTTEIGTSKYVDHVDALYYTYVDAGRPALPCYSFLQVSSRLTKGVLKINTKLQLSNPEESTWHAHRNLHQHLLLFLL